MFNCENEIKELIEGFDGNVYLYVSDDKGNEIRYNENEVVETASCIKLFILIDFYHQIVSGKKSKYDLIHFSPKTDMVEHGSGIIQYLDDFDLSAYNMAILMMIVSDNIATNKMIEYLGFENINNTIKELGFEKTYLNARKLDFNIYKSVGKTTAYEYGRAYKMLLNKEILDSESCDEIIKILANQTKNEMIIKYLPTNYISRKGEEGVYLKYIATKSGGLGSGERDPKDNCRNDGGIISTLNGDYVISIFMDGLKDFYFYNDNPAIVLGAKISKLVFDEFEKNN